MKLKLYNRDEIFLVNLDTVLLYPKIRKQSQ